MINRSLFVLLLCLTTISVDADEKPNVVFFFIDDLGWSDVGFQGEGGFYETPHIDKLSQAGMIFTNAYANAPNCAPSRACLMSGKYTPRHGIYTVGDPERGHHQHRKLNPAENKTVLDDHFVTIAEALQTSGYTTATMGKWHLGTDPTAQGFDVNIAGREWGSPSGGGYHSPFKYPNLINPEPGEYLTDRLGKEACAFIETNKEKSFFLYLTHYAVHTPLQAKEELIQKYEKKPKLESHSNAKYAAMIESTDDSIGAVLAKLDDLELTDNTIVVFFSDNGGHEGATSNAPLKGAKGMLYEGGIRVPMVVKWPNVTRPGSKCDAPVMGIDFYPTLLEMTKTLPPKNDVLDGVSLVSLLKGSSSTLAERPLFWHFPCYLEGTGDPLGGPFRTTPAGAIRVGDWKLIEWFETGHLELYNLKDDLSESVNLVDSHPEKVQELHAKMKDWRKVTNAPVPMTPNPKYDPRVTSKNIRKKK